jgi:hypothetical protein
VEDLFCVILVVHVGVKISVIPKYVLFVVMFLREMGGKALMPIIRESMKIKMHTNLTKFGGDECVKNIRVKSN